MIENVTRVFAMIEKFVFLHDPTRNRTREHVAIRYDKKVECTILRMYVFTNMAISRLPRR